MNFPYLSTAMTIKHVLLSLIMSLVAVPAVAVAQSGTVLTDTILFDDGSVYMGQISDSLFNGNGKMIYADKTVYQGEWKNGLWNGKGKLIYPDGDLYDGEFKEHQFNGFGTYTYADGGRYEGYWQNGMFNGAGTMNYADGSVYAGNWKEDRKDGLGVLFDNSTETLYKGYFSNDVFVGNVDEFYEDVDYAQETGTDSCFHRNGDVSLFVTYGTEHQLSFHANFHISDKFFTGGTIGFNTSDYQRGKVSETFDEETGERTTLIGWDWYMDEIMTETTYTIFKIAGECGFSWRMFSAGAAIGIGIQNSIRNCRSLATNDSYYEAGTLYYRQKITGAKFYYNLFADCVLNRNIPFLSSCSLRVGYGNIDGFYFGAGITF